jgi:hypothetical protein
MRTLVLAILTAGLIASAHADDALRSLCPDRPGKATSACTLDEGHFQIESDVFNGSFQHAAGVTTDIWFITDPTLKYGVAGDLDVEANFAPYVIVRTHDSATGATRIADGTGDLFLRAKWALVGNSGSDFAAVLEPYLKIPTARAGIGNGAVEGGLLVPLSLSLGSDWSIGSTPEFDLLKDQMGSGAHPAFADVVAIDRTVGGGVTLGAEFWESTDFDPSQTAQSWSFDISAAWQPTAEVQLDCGLNLGLNRNTPGSQVYAGVTRRF